MTKDFVCNLKFCLRKALKIRIEKQDPHRYVDHSHDWYGTQRGYYDNFYYY